jgi:hypothetical protein
MPGIYSHQRFCDLASDEIARLATAVDGAEPATPVPTCGRWTMADLVQHIGHIHRWAAAMVADLSPTRHSRKKADLPLPADPATWPAWLAEAQTTLVPVLRAADPDARMWAWGPTSTPASGPAAWSTRPPSTASTPLRGAGMIAGDRRRRLASDAHRVIGYMSAVLTDARRAQAEVPDGVAASVTVWRSWAARLDAWAVGEGGPPDPPAAR